MRCDAAPLVCSAVLAIASIACSNAGRDEHAAHTPAAAPATPAPDSSVRTNPATPPGPAPAGMVWVPGGTFWMGCENCGMPDALPSHLVTVAGFWMDAHAGDQRRVRAVRGGDQLRHRGRASADVRRIFLACRPTSSCRGRRCSRPTVNAGAARQSAAVVGVHAGRELEASGQARPASIDGRADHPVVHVAFEDAMAYADVGGQAAADRGRVRVRGARRPRSQHVRVGQRAASRQQGGGEHLAGAVPGARRGRRRLCGDVAGDGVSAERLRPLRHGRQRLAVVRRLVSPRLLRDARRAGRGRDRTRAGLPTASIRTSPARPSASSAAARISAPIEYCARYLVGSRGKSEVTSGTSNLGFRLVRAGDGTNKEAK